MEFTGCEESQQMGRRRVGQAAELAMVDDRLVGSVEAGHPSMASEKTLSIESHDRLSDIS